MLVLVLGVKVGLNPCYSGITSLSLQNYSLSTIPNHRFESKYLKSVSDNLIGNDYQRFHQS